MKKTNKMATIAQFNRQSCKYTHIERRIFENEGGECFVKINGDYTSVGWLLNNGRKVDIWF